MERKDGFELRISHERDEVGRYIGTRIDVLHLQSGDCTTFWSDHLHSLGAALEEWKAAKDKSADSLIA